MCAHTHGNSNGKDSCAMKLFPEHLVKQNTQDVKIMLPFAKEGGFLFLFLFGKSKAQQRLFKYSCRDVRRSQLE
jgi:hypothetical protein